MTEIVSVGQTLILAGFVVLMGATSYYAFKSAVTLTLAKAAVRRRDEDAWAHWAAKYLFARINLHTITCPLQWIHAPHSHTWWEGTIPNGKKAWMETDFNQEDE